MANLNTSFSKKTAHPYVTWTLKFSQTGRTATTATYSVTIKMKLDSGQSYGYGYNLYADIYQGSTKKTTITLKSDAYSDNGGNMAGSWSKSGSVTFSTNATGGTIGSIRVYTYSTQDTSRDQQIDVTGEVTKSTFNTAPKLSGSVTLNQSGTISEKATSVTVSWPAATDAENNVSKYRVIRYVNNVNNKTTEYSNSTRSCTDDISGLGEGTSIYYKVDCYDTYSTYSNQLTSATITKNSFTTATLNVSTPNIKYGTTGVACTRTNPSNTSGNTTFTYTLSSDVKVYNPTITGTSFTLGIQQASETMSGPYIKLSDLKTKFSSSSYKGTITITLSTTNKYGTTKSSSKTVNVDLRVAPTAASGFYVTNGYTINNTMYYIPNKRNLTINWTASTERNGQSVYYNIYYSLNNGGWTLLKEGVTAVSHSITLPSITEQSTCKFKIRSISYYDGVAYTTDYDTSSINLHYWMAPSISVSNYVRTDTSASFTVTLSKNTSLPNLTLTAGWRGDLTGTLTGSTGAQNKTITGLSANTEYVLRFYVKDNSGFMDTTETVTVFYIKPNIAVFEIAKDLVTVNVPFLVNSGSIEQGADFNNWTEPGSYYCSYYTATNAPVNNEGTSGILTVENMGAGIFQTFKTVSVSAGATRLRIWVRARTGTNKTWCAWTNIVSVPK